MTSSRTTSAPTSPSKSRESFLQRVQSLTAGVARPEILSRQSHNKEHCFTLLIIDDQNTDWSKYFRGRQLHGDYDIRVEQAEFSELSVVGSTENGATVVMTTQRGGNKVSKSFKPHFVLVRQNIRDQPDDYKHILLGLMYDNVPAINNLDVIYNFQDKPWVFAHMLQIQKKLGKNVFPLIQQNYYPNHKEMMTAPHYPCVFKVGHAHSGAGKVRVQTATEYQDMTTMVAITGSYCTTEPLIDAKYDLHVQKIGNTFKAFMRKSISGNWKTNTGAAMLEQMPVSERLRGWLQAVSQMFGGMDMCSLEALVDSEGLEHIIELNDSAMPLMGDTQEEDRRQIVDLVCSKMQYCCRPPVVPGSSSGGVSDRPEQTRPAAVPPPRPPRPEEPPLSAGIQPTSSAETSSELKRRDSQGSQSGSGAAGTGVTRSGSLSGERRRSGTQQSGSSAAGSTSSSVTTASTTSSAKVTRQGSAGQSDGKTEDGEDTMTNLRKTFAGIFGDM